MGNNAKKSFPWQEIAYMCFSVTFYIITIFIVNYRRQSSATKIDLINRSRKTSATSLAKETSMDPAISSSTTDNFSSIINELDLEIKTDLTPLGPILSSNQRSLIVHQWHEIMLEEISLRHFNEYIQNKMASLKILETNLKNLKAKIFCTNNSCKKQSTTNMKVNNQCEQVYLPRRCLSLQSLASMPSSWLLTVQSAAYSDILDGTSNKTTERTIIFNKDFFDQLEHMKRDRQKFEHDLIKDLLLLNYST